MAELRTSGGSQIIFDPQRIVMVAAEGDAGHPGTAVYGITASAVHIDEQPAPFIDRLKIAPSFAIDPTIRLYGSMVPQSHRSAAPYKPSIHRLSERSLMLVPCCKG